jgi:hypothetical protein
MDTAVFYNKEHNKIEEHSLKNFELTQKGILFMKYWGFELTSIDGLCAEQWLKQFGPLKKAA